MARRDDGAQHNQMVPKKRPRDSHSSGAKEMFGFTYNQVLLSVKLEPVANISFWLRPYWHLRQGLDLPPTSSVLSSKPPSNNIPTMCLLVILFKPYPDPAALVQSQFICELCRARGPTLDVGRAQPQPQTAHLGRSSASSHVSLQLGLPPPNLTPAAQNPYLTQSLTK